MFACTSFSSRLSSPEEDLPWQGPEKKEVEGGRNKSCHSAGTPEPFLSLAAKVRGISQQGERCRKYRAFLQLGLLTRSRWGRLGVVRSLSSALFSSALPLPIRGQNYSPGNDPDTDDPSGPCSGSPGVPEGFRLPARELKEILFGQQSLYKPWRVLEGREEGDR